MKRLAWITGSVALALVVSVGWQIAAAQIADRQLREDLRDMASQGGAQIGLLEFKSIDDSRDAVIRVAKQHGIALAPNQVTVRRTGAGVAAVTYLGAEYTEPVKLPGFSFDLHFTTTNDR
jgi:hypothetical protein